MALAIVDELRGVDYKAAGTLQRGVDPGGQMKRGEWDGLLGALVQAGLVGMEEAEYEKDGEVRRYRKVMLTEMGREFRAGSAKELLLSDGVVEAFGGQAEGASRSKVGKKRKSAPAKNGLTRPLMTDGAQGTAVRLTAEGEAVAARLKEWRAAEAKRLGVPAYVVLHDRTLTALAVTRPGNAIELLRIDGIGPAKVEKFGAVILELCVGR